ncbi:hypothetical protein BT96DRAFT_924470 [Gymnopus androsaceus JB14]|uniref:Uncharacterized protein n=1 Tax=Gymnopus androsaceus JB14 TaxID=1447944 RepID=A0A6A4H3N1_9AGAR|nr:hypothetical protein BT96DRAFT_924470 [Gymnopus androsaceus JB14]
MDWQEPFKKAVLYFKRSKYGECLRLLNYALEHGGSDQYAIYDSRAAVYEKTLRLREALLDVKEAIRLAPNRWQCYSRAARLFLLIRKFDEASKMVELALQKINPTDDKNRTTLIALQSQVFESRKRLCCHVGMLPTELLSTIFGYMVEEDAVLVILISRKDPIRKSAWWVQRSKGRIRKLCLRRTLSDKVDWSLDKLDGIQWDNIRSCHLEDIDILKQLEKASALNVISQLETLEIRDKLMDSREDFVSHLGDSLKNLTIDGAIMSLGDLQVHSLVSLKAVQLGERFMDDLFQLLTNNPSLESLVVGSPFNTFRDLPETTLTLAHLAVLDYSSGSTQLFNFLRLPSLEVLSCRHCVQSNAILQCLLDSTTDRLKSLSFDSCAHHATASILDALASPELCPALSHLDFSACADVTSSLLIRVVKPRLSQAQAHNTSQEEMTEETMSEIPCVAEIRSLITNECPAVTTESLSWFREKVPDFTANGRR